MKNWKRLLRLSLHVLFGLLTLLVLAQSAYQLFPRKYKLLSEYTGDLHPSMQAFYAAEDIGYGESESFSVKLLRCVKVLYEDTLQYESETGELVDYSVSRNVYLYRLIIAPKYAAPINRHFISVRPTNEIDTYLLGYSPPRYPSGGLLFNDMWMALYPQFHWGIKETSKLISMEYRFTLDNAENELQQKAGLSDAEFDKGMTNLRIEVTFDRYKEILPLDVSFPTMSNSRALLDLDRKKETLYLSLMGDLPYVTSAGDPLALENPDVLEILETGNARVHRGWFTMD